MSGYGELFRVLSFEEIGSAAMLSRAVGGSLMPRLSSRCPDRQPQSGLAMERLILPELGHMVYEGKSAEVVRSRTGHPSNARPAR